MDCIASHAYLGYLGHGTDIRNFSQEKWLLGTEIVINMNNKGRNSTKFRLQSLPYKVLQKNSDAVCYDCYKIVFWPLFIKWRQSLSKKRNTRIHNDISFEYVRPRGSLFKCRFVWFGWVSFALPYLRVVR